MKGGNILSVCTLRLLFSGPFEDRVTKTGHDSQSFTIDNEAKSRPGTFFLFIITQKVRKGDSK